jgi:monoamine oxidase
MATDADVAVLGASLAGLTTAHQLHEQGVSTLVLEGSDRVGGRVRTEPLGDSSAELGASHGPAHFAGAERGSWPNNMEGAVDSGERAADRVLGLLAS